MCRGFQAQPHAANTENHTAQREIFDMHYQITEDISSSPTHPSYGAELNIHHRKRHLINKCIHDLEDDAQSKNKNSSKHLSNYKVLQHIYFQKKKKCSTAQGSVPMHPPPHTSVPNSSLVQTIDLLIMEEEVPKNLQIGRFFNFTTFGSSFFVCIFLYLIF